jgi:hypothetical protein
LFSAFARFAQSYCSIFTRKLGFARFGQTDAFDTQLPQQTGTNLLAIMTAMSAVSTFVAGALVPYTGVMNIYVLTQFFAAASIFCFWVPAGNSVVLLSLFAAVYGLCWGSFWNLLANSTAELFFHLDVFPVVVGSMYVAASIAFFVNAPVFGALVDVGAFYNPDGTRAGANYLYALSFAGGIYLAGVACIAVVRFWHSGWKLAVKV